LLASDCGDRANVRDLSLDRIILNPTANLALAISDLSGMPFNTQVQPRFAGMSASIRRQKRTAEPPTEARRIWPIPERR
jgi:hypothetical protein